MTIELTTPDAAAADEDSPIVPKVDGRLYLRSAQNTEGAVVAENDDRSEIPLRTDSRIERTLAAGEYTVEATTHIPRTAGDFTLTITHSAARANCAPTALGTLTNAAPTLTANGTAWPASPTNCESAAKTDSQSAYYGFTLSEPGMVEISLSSSSTGADPFLYLRNGARNFGTHIASDDDGGTGNAALIKRSLEAGSYTVEATSQTASAGGTFDLSVALLADCRVDLGTLSPSSHIDVSGTWLTACQSAARGGRYARFYTFKMARFNRANISLSSEYADTYMYLRKGTATSGEYIAGNDNIGWGSENSFISESLSPGDAHGGTYTIEATTTYGRYGADRQFRISINVPNDCQPLVALGVLESAISEGGEYRNDCSSRDRVARSARFYTFSLKEKTEVELLLRARLNEDPYMYLRAGDGTLSGGSIAADDDGYAVGSLHSKIRRVLDAGTYTVEATTAFRFQEGEFTLTLTPFPIVSCVVSPLGALTAAATRNGNWTDGCYSSEREGRFARFYTFSLASRMKVSVDLASTEADSYLYLRDGDGTQRGAQIARDDDGGTGDNARIRRALAAGTYTVEATAYGAAEAGAFTLTVAPDGDSPLRRPRVARNAVRRHSPNGNVVVRMLLIGAPIQLRALLHIHAERGRQCGRFFGIRGGFIRECPRRRRGFRGLERRLGAKRRRPGDGAGCAAGTYTAEVTSVADETAGDFTLKIAPDAHNGVRRDIARSRGRLDDCDIQPVLDERLRLGARRRLIRQALHVHAGRAQIGEDRAGFDGRRHAVLPDAGDVRIGSGVHPRRRARRPRRLADARF